MDFSFFFCTPSNAHTYSSPFIFFCVPHRDSYGLEVAVDFIKGKWELRVLSMIKNSIWMSCNQIYNLSQCILWWQEAFNSIISIMSVTKTNTHSIMWRNTSTLAKLRHLLMNDFVFAAHVHAYVSTSAQNVLWHSFSYSEYSHHNWIMKIPFIFMGIPFIYWTFHGWNYRGGNHSIMKPKRKKSTHILCVS